MVTARYPQPKIQGLHKAHETIAIARNERVDKRTASPAVEKQLDHGTALDHATNYQSVQATVQFSAERARLFEWGCLLAVGTTLLALIKLVY